MGKKRQRYCVALGALFLVGSGVLAGISGLIANRNVAVRVFEPFLSSWLLRLGAAFIVLACVGAAAAWNGTRCMLCTYSWVTLIMGIISGVFGVMAMTRIGSDASLIDSWCQADQASSGPGTSARMTNKTAPGASLPAAVQSGYESMRDALIFCRQQDPFALQLQDCPSAIDQANMRWQDNPYRELLRWAEDQYTCGGFCENGIPLFALPTGMVSAQNMGDLRPACFAALTAELRATGTIACAALLCAAALVVIPVFSACWLACAPPPKLRKGHFQHHTRGIELEHEDEDEDEEEDDDDEYEEVSKGYSTREMTLAGLEDGGDHNQWSPFNSKIRYQTVPTEDQGGYISEKLDFHESDYGSSSLFGNVLGPAPPAHVQRLRGLLRIPRGNFDTADEEPEAPHGLPSYGAGVHGAYHDSAPREGGLAAAAVERDEPNDVRAILAVIARQGELDVHMEESKRLLPLDTPLEVIFSELDKYKKGSVADTDMWQFTQQVSQPVPFNGIVAAMRDIQMLRPHDKKVTQGRFSLREVGTLVLPKGTSQYEAVNRVDSDNEALSRLYIARYSDQCPDCGAYIQRSSESAGCPNVTCPVCKRVFRCFVMDKAFDMNHLDAQGRLHLYRLIQNAAKVAEENERLKKKLATNPGYTALLQETFEFISGGSSSFVLGDLRRALFSHMFWSSERELHLIWARYTRDGEDCTFTDFTRQLRPFQSRPDK